MNALLFLDTETGGTDPQKTSLLSVGLAVWEDGCIKAKKEIFVREEVFKVTHQALKTNQIDLRAHFSRAQDVSEALHEIVAFCEQHFSRQLPITLAGHNIQFDIAFLKALFERENQPFHSYFSHRSVDTASILMFLRHTGLLSEDIASSDKAFAYFSIAVSQRHSALADAIATAELFTKLVQLVQGQTQEIMGVLSDIDALTGNPDSPSYKEYQEKSL